ncbi:MULTISPECIES: hypothetical protein [unclassified Streptomyces]|uniref:hypothetical protein n=1 Tax=Streptomyces TaxID=1883 RepID=UPI0001C19CEF|nr:MULTISPECIES: hypothetical protein [unclassified Streptomyces]AEN09751.1 hypothetical protein SACTE_1843 [Streptomyces sp. SirexAA-E]MYR64710.1 hypothetical protein [Streptomyces sp. SID4939]MYS01471.1 hypothetical protein [Streptomyces sp. SID4940]MYT64392.1 hypothetical protein [Streptomyces sp. SID8357]MYT87205.1 hypothetical protein [Streptomyces sp. SID8360]
MNRVNNTLAVRAEDLNDSYVGEHFSYEHPKTGVELHARIAAIQSNGRYMNIYLDGLMTNGTTDVLTVGDWEELYFPPIED